MPKCDLKFNRLAFSNNSGTACSRCDSKTDCDEVTADQLHNLYVLAFSKTADPEQCFRNISLAHLTKGFACRYHEEIVAKHGYISFIASGNAKEQSTFYTVSNCMDQCTFGCQPHEVGIYARSVLNDRHQRHLLLYNCSEPPDWFQYVIGFLIIAFIVMIFALVFWLVPYIKKKHASSPPNDESEKHTASGNSQKDPGHFQGLESRKIPKGCLDNLSPSTTTNGKTVNDAKKAENEEGENQPLNVAQGGSEKASQVSSSDAGK
ncbi:hypothetical protein L596_018387 [Steinernema carpocapsae]|uniref:Uncharacterized protein n=1 Tax=Steinernema carpocapsae TaxID=34508 RepID=A0A4V6A208_STECR|nr:hypothetical protein L596_018387 [Steinernema carpocapsae]